MNAATLSELKAVVERAVRPIRATFSRKRRMREELLAHLTSIFGEESERLGDEQAALRQAKQRFGDPNELTSELQQAVPRWDRCRSMLEHMGCQPGESAWHLAAKHFLVTLAIYAAVILILILWFGDLRNLGRWKAQTSVAPILIGAVAGAVVLMALLNVILSIVLAPLLLKIGPGLVSTRRGRIFLAVLCGFAVLCGLVPHFTGAAVLFILMARQTVKQWHYEADWA